MFVLIWLSQCLSGICIGLVLLEVIVLFIHPMGESPSAEYVLFSPARGKQFVQVIRWYMALHSRFQSSNPLLQTGDSTPNHDSNPMTSPLLPLAGRERSSRCCSALRSRTTQIVSRCLTRNWVKLWNTLRLTNKKVDVLWMNMKPF